ncbi:hypothetical protein LCGC14_1366460 [marine sediment metagenome]|uniref:Uncharacterized protein n=1 Tax=marine sediment metagenome TaxID=412755 RepID=A0A0F9N8Q8_9ZZZZ
MEEVEFCLIIKYGWQCHKCKHLNIENEESIDQGVVECEQCGEGFIPVPE